MYADRFGGPFTTDEVYGYWLFVAGAVIAVLGMVLFLTSMGAGRTGTREVAYLLAGGGLAIAIAGLVVGQSFDRQARLLVYAGLLFVAAALAWFLSVFPAGWTLSTGGAQGVVLVYVFGVALIALSGAIAPLAVGQSRARADVEAELAAARGDATVSEQTVADLREELANREARIESLEAERDAVGAEAATATEDRDAAVARADRLTESMATFEVYRDRSDAWRWRLVHQNGNIIATSGESYASDRNARRGMRSVKRNALGAATVWQRDESDPDPEPTLLAEDPQAIFELYQDQDDEYRWRLRHENGETIAAATRGFSSRQAAENGIESVRATIGPADYLEFDPAGIEVYEDAGGEYRWRLVHRNGNVLGDSGEGYATRSNARRAAT